MIVVDSSVWIDYFRQRLTPETMALNSLIGRQRIVLGDLVLAEVLQGCTTDVAHHQVRSVFQNLTVIEMAGEEIALRASDHYRALRSRGITVRKTIDTLIAARCIADRLVLLHSDRDFDPFAEHLGLRVFAPDLH